MDNHLIIGLGGTGGKILRSFRKNVYLAFRETDPEGINMGYLYLDSSDAMMSLDDSTWKLMGENLQLGKSNQVFISGASLKQHLEEIDKFPGIRPWIGNVDHWSEILNSIQGVAAGGQKRRLGRFLFACSPKIFFDALDKQVKQLRERSGLTDITFHICAGLAGGTGSGTIIDVITQIRQKFTPSGQTNYKILLYVLLPDTNPPAGWDTGNYHANGYAALLELNALSVGTFDPCDILGDYEKIRNVNPFNGCYLITNQNENGMEINVEEDIPNIVADFLFQKLVAVRAISWESLSRLEDAENGDNTPETSPDSSTGERSKRFLSFGIKRLLFPEEEIREYLAYNYARQSCLQLKYNHWSDDLGYLDEPRQQDLYSFIRDEANLTNWLLTDEHLCYSKVVLPDDRKNDQRLKPIDEHWNNQLTRFLGFAKNSGNVNWLNELSKLCITEYEADYRKSGVIRYYNTKIQAKKDIAKEVRRTFEAYCYSEWRTGSRCLAELSTILRLLLDDLQLKLQRLLERQTEANDKVNNYAEQVKNNEVSWGRLSMLHKLFGGRERLLNLQKNCLQDLYINRTRQKAYEFARQLLLEIITELTDLKVSIEKSADVLSESLKRFDSLIHERLKDDAKPDERNQVVKFYEPELVRRLTNTLIRNEDEQRTQTSKMRSRLAERLGDNPSFGVFVERMTISAMVDLMEVASQESIQIAHNLLVANIDERVLGVSIIQKLRQKYDSNTEDLRRFVYGMVKYAGNYLRFNQLEISKKGAGIPNAQTMASAFTVIIPKDPDYADFVERLKRVFSESTTMPVEFIESEHRKNEITMINIKNLFPLRFAEQVEFLRKRYMLRVGQPDADKTKMVLHIEGDGTQHPRIFVLSAEEERNIQAKIRKEVLPYCLVAKAADLLVELEDSGTGEKNFALLRKKASGVDDSPIVLASSLEEAFNAVDNRKLQDTFENVVRDALRKDYEHISKRKELQEKILIEVSKLKEKRKYTVTTPEMIKLNSAADIAITELLRIRE